jgi:HEPN domain-containing protein
MVSKNELNEWGSRLAIASLSIARMDYQNAMDRHDWNMSIRRSQEAVELMAKAAICSLGEEFVRGHGEKPHQQLSRLLDNERGRLTQIPINSPVPKVIGSYHEGGNYDRQETLYGLEVRIFGDIIKIFQVVAGQRSEIISQEIPKLLTEFPVDILVDTIDVYDEKNRFVIAFKSEVLLLLNETGYTIKPINNVHYCKYLRPDDWAAMISDAAKLGEFRDKAFYYEKIFTQEEAQECGKIMYNIISNISLHMTTLEFPIGKITTNVSNRVDPI